MRSRPSSRGKPYLQPCIAEVLRTCIFPPTLILRAEKILEETIQKVPRDAGSSTNTALHESSSIGQTSIYRLYLSDGEHMIQALVAPHLHPLIQLQEVTEGSLVEVRDYEVWKAARLHGEGKVIVLSIEDLVCISLSRPTTRESHDELLLNGGGFLLEEETKSSALGYSQGRAQARAQALSSPPSPLMTMAPEVPSSQETDAFETIRIDPEIVKKRRQTLHEINSNKGQKRKRQSEYDTPPTKRRDDRSEASSSQDTDDFETAENDLETVKKIRQALYGRGPASHVRQGLDYDNEATPAKHTRSETMNTMSSYNGPVPASAITHLPVNNQSPALGLPFHTLNSLLHPSVSLPPKNYSVTILAIISWISPTTVSRPPFPPRRSMKVHDPSITSQQVGVSISVFIDAATFKPRHGTIALFQGVVMQKHGEEAILNAYPGLRDTEWYVDSEKRLAELGHDVRGMREWWEERKKTRAPNGVKVGDTVDVPGRV